MPRHLVTDVAALMATAGYIFGPWVDFSAFILPVLVACAFIPAWSNHWIDSESCPLKEYLLLVVAVDVAHVYATLFRTYFDSNMMETRSKLLLGSPPIILIFSTVVHFYSETLFWSLVAYFAIYHFIAQDYGFVALYKARVGERDPIDFRLDYWVLWAGALCPVLLWHATPTKRFSWFDNGEEVLLRLPMWTRPCIIGAYVLVAMVYIGRQFILFQRHGRVNPGKIVIMVLAWLTWALGGFIDHFVLSLAFLNLFHGVPFIFIVWFVANQTLGDGTKNTKKIQDSFFRRGVRWMTRRGNWMYYYLFLLCLAFVEELLWDALIWQLYLPNLSMFSSVEWPQLVGWQRSFITAILALPQILHYYLDAFIWKMDGSNVGLREALFPRPPRTA
eukprot:Rmarinus@m.15562